MGLAWVYTEDRVKKKNEGKFIQGNARKASLRKKDLPEVIWVLSRTATGGFTGNRQAPSDLRQVHRIKGNWKKRQNEEKMTVAL